MRKIAFISGSRADYGLMKPLMISANKSKLIKSFNIFTGTHLTSSYSFASKEIKNKELKIDFEVDLLIDKDTRADIGKYISRGLEGFSRIFSELQPDMICILGDRYEIFAASIAAMVNNVPIAHLHGGEITQGAIDDSIRHSITKMAHLHFVSTESHKNRVSQLGEDSSNIINVGAIGLDNIHALDCLTNSEIADTLSISNFEKLFLVTYHPVTLEHGKNIKSLKELLDALLSFDDRTIIFSTPNLDPEASKITKLLKEFCKANVNSHFFSSLGQQVYLSCLSCAECIIGNSSSGIIEAPSLNTPTVNVGNRQKGRERAKSILDVDSKKDEIVSAINHACSTNFRKNIKIFNNPYDNGGATNKIIKTLETHDISNLLDKRFHDLDFRS